MKRSTVACGMVGIVIAIVLLRWTRPTSIHVERTERIAAAPHELYPLVADLARWSSWNVWSREIRRCSEPTEGVGAWCEGEMARLTIERADPDRRVEIALTFRNIEHDAGAISVELVPIGDETDVTLAFDASTTFTDRAFGVAWNVQARLGSDFEHDLEGLASSAP